jgi:transposase
MKRYDKEFREQALKLSDEIGVKKASEQLGVIYGTLADWRKQRTKQVKKPKIQQSEEEQKAENERLKKENAELHKANAILKEALCFFVDDRKR